MAQLLEITYEDISHLNDGQLTDFLRRLLHLKAARFQIAASGVSVALNINVPDGGEDGRIEWTAGPVHTDYVPHRLTMFQCKATNMGPAACAKEVCRQDADQLKHQVEHVLEAGKTQREVAELLVVSAGGGGTTANFESIRSL